MIFVSSWDDGHSMDVKLAEMLSRHGMKGTFYTPIRNREGREVMSHIQMRLLDHSGFEVASHTQDHAYLKNLDGDEVKQQIRDGKLHLEDILGHEVGGFCYPGGKWNARIRREVVEAGFLHARTISNLWLKPNPDVFSLPTTVQFYPHSARVLLSNFVKDGHYPSRIAALKVLFRGNDWLAAMKDLARQHAESESVFHIWGHSWEVEYLDLWQPLDELLGFIGSLNPQKMTVSELAARMRAEQNPEATL